MLPYDRQNIKSSNWQLTNYLDQNYTKVAMGSSTGLVPPPKLVDHESNLLHSEIRGGMFYPETAELRTDCYQYNGNLQTIDYLGLCTKKAKVGQLNFLINFTTIW
jgi:hypothetical protein